MPTTFIPNPTSLVLAIENDPTTPTLAFGDGDSGFYESSDDVLGVSIGGSREFFFASGRFGSDEATGPQVANEAASATNPTLIPNRADDNSGIGQQAADKLSLIAGAKEMVRLTESTALANYVGMTLDANDQVSLTSASGSTWRLLETIAVTVDWDGGVTITATDGLSAYLGDITQTADQATTITTASTLYVANPTAGSNITITNNYAINTESAAFLTAAGVWTDNPSTRLKKHDILDATHEDMRVAISQIRPRSWVYNDEWGDEGRSRYGVVAEEQPDFLYGLGTTQRNVTSPSIMAGFALAGLSYHERRMDELEQRVILLEAK